MRVFGLFLLLAALLGGGCEAPAREPEEPAASVQTLTFSRQGRTSRLGVRDVLPIPAGFPDDGLDPREAADLEKRDVWVVGFGTVDRILRDDTKPPRHQRFVVRTSPEQTVMLAHNIDLAPRVPVARGDTIAFRGEYVWNEQGGVVHWTHRDRRDKSAGGWIVWKGQNFR